MADLNLKRKRGIPGTSSLRQGVTASKPTNLAVLGCQPSERRESFSRGLPTHLILDNATAGVQYGRALTFAKTSKVREAGGSHPEG